MSRGIGKVQSELLRILEREDRLDTFQLAALVYQVKADEHGRTILTRSQLTAIRRGLQGLLKRGRIEEFGRNSLGRMQWRRLSSRDRDIAKAETAIEAEIANGRPRPGECQMRMLKACMNHTSASDIAAVIGREQVDSA